MGPQNVEKNPVLQQFLRSQGVFDINVGLYYRVCHDTYGYLINQFEQTVGATIGSNDSNSIRATDYNFLTEKATLLSQTSIFYATPFARLWSEQILPLITEAAASSGAEASNFARQSQRNVG